MPTPLIEDLPHRVDYKIGADLVTKHRFPVSFRSLERWPLRTKLKVNGRNTVETQELLDVADAKSSRPRSPRSPKRKPPDPQPPGPVGKARAIAAAIACCAASSLRMGVHAQPLEIFDCNGTGQRVTPARMVSGSIG